MAEYKDILFDNNGIVRIENGDFVVGPCEGQNAKLLLLSERGEWRFDADKGIGLRRLANVKVSPGVLLSLRKDVYSQFRADGSKVKSLTITPTIFKLESERI